MEEKEFSKLVNIDTIQVPAQVMIINGQRVEQGTQEIFILKCPVCNNTIQQFNQGNINRVDIIKFVCNNKDTLNDSIKYCPNCGQRINFNYEIIEADFTVTNIQEETNYEETN